MLKLVSLKLTKFIPVAFFPTLLLGLGLLLFPAQPARAQGPINIGDLPPGKVVTITFRAAITTSPAVGVTQVCNQATISGNNFATIVTNDPTTPAANDPTCTPLDLPTVTIAAGVTPSESGPTNGSFIISLNKPAPAGGLTVNYSQIGSTASTPADYSLAAGANVSGLTATNFTIAAGQTSATILIVPVDDPLDDDAETVQLNLNAGSGYRLGATTTATRTITDNDTPSVSVTPLNLTISEPNGSGSFTITLTSQPTAPVTISLTSTDTTECTVPASASLTALTWDTGVTVTVTAVDDLVTDGAQPCLIQTSPASSSDPAYNGLAVSDVNVTVTDDDIPSFVISPTAGLTTTETGGTATFTVQLKTQPTAAVTLTLTSSTVTEGLINPAVLSFTPLNWNLPQTITVTGVNDDMADGNQPYSIITNDPISPDPNYNGPGANPPDVVVVNQDDDSPGFIVSTISGNTSEAGGTATFTMRLTSQPTATVTIPFTSSDPSEGSLSPNVAIFTLLSWNIPQTITVTGVDDAETDGSMGYTIQTGPANSADLAYNGLNPADVAVLNLDNESNNQAGFIYLPLIFKNFAIGPDLVIDSLTATGNGVTVVIKNQGTMPVIDAFWVEVYLNPTTLPTGPNQEWYKLGGQGLVWGIDTLPITPGQSLTLNLSSPTFFPTLSSPLPLNLPPGSQVYAQVDSANTGVSTGGVLEADETNNISGPVSATLSEGPASVVSGVGAGEDLPLRE